MEQRDFTRLRSDECSAHGKTFAPEVPLQSPDPELIEALEGRRAYRALKRALDVTIAIVAFIVISPLLLVFGIVIFATDPHAAPIYASLRCGKRGVPFKMYKLRTMCANAEHQLNDLLHLNEADGPVFKIKDDPRVTWIGKFLRKCSLDELPQLVNVIKGDMSIVGPRPPLPREVERYTPYQRQRLLVRPGLTCYWQVQPRRNDLSFDEWVEFDIRYIRHQCLLLDLKLIVKTIGVMITGEGV